MSKKNSLLLTLTLAATCAGATMLAGNLSEGERVTTRSGEEQAPIYGWCVDATAKDKFPSVWTIGTESTEHVYNLEKMWSNLVDEYLVLSNGYLHDGVAYGYIKELWQGLYPFGLQWASYNIETGKIINKTPLNINECPPYFNAMAYVPQENLMYGVGEFANLPGFYFMSVSPDDPEKAVKQVPIDINQCTATSFCYNGAEDCFYLINVSRQVVRIQKDGYVETIATIDLDNTPNVYSGLWWNADDNKYYWNPIWEDHSSIVTLDVNTGKTEKLYDTPSKNQFSFFLSEQQGTPSPYKPAMPEFVSKEFADGACSGKVTYKLPSDAIDGTPLTGTLTCTLKINGEKYKDMQGQPGSNVTIEVENIAEGEDEFVFFASTDKYSSDRAVEKIYVGSDTPSAPKDIKVDGNVLSWEPVSTSVHGGYVDYASIKYEVMLNNEPVGETSDTHITLSIPEDAPLADYTASVVAIAGEKRSAEAKSKIIAGAPMTMPVLFPPTKDDFKLCTVVDANGDGRVWTLSSGVTPYFEMGYSAQGVLEDDWLFMPPVAFENADTFYNLEFEAGSRANVATKEYMSVCIAKHPLPDEAEVIIEEFLVDTPRSFKPFDTLFQVKEPGTYYIGFRCTSEPYQAGIMLRNVKLYDSNLPGDAPARVDDLKATVGNGEYEATVTFNFPKTNLFGKDLDKNAQLSATVASGIDTVTVEGVPGAEGTAKVKIEDGDNTITVTVASGELKGPEATVNAYAGVVAPATPENIKAVVSDDMMSVRLTWDAVTTGIDDGYIIPEDIQYQVCEIVSTESGLGFEFVGEPTSDTFFDYVVEPGSAQRACQLTVLAFNSAGDSGQIDRGAVCIVGTPYTLPFSDDFEPAGFKTQPWIPYVLSDKYSAQWGLYYASGLNAAWGNNVILWSVAENAGALGREGMPRFSTLNTNAASLSLDIYVGDRAPKMTILAEYPGCTDLVEVGTISKVSGAEFQKVEIELPEVLMNKNWVGIFFQVEFADKDQLFALDSVEVQAKVSGVENLTDSCAIVGGTGNVTLYGFDGENVILYTLDGKMVVNEIVDSDNAVYGLEKGVYVVKAGGRTVKVSVK